VVSRDQGRAEAFAANHGAALATTSYDELLSRPDVHVVYVATPNDLHPEQVLAAAAAGKHVLCEKPLALTVGAAREMVEACRRAGVKLGTGFHIRHHVAHQEAKRLIEGGEIGDVVLIQAQASSLYQPSEGWRLNREQAGSGASNAIGVHALDLVRFLAGSEVVEVRAMDDVRPGEWYDRLDLTLLRFANGVMASVTSNQRTPYFEPDLDVYGTDGRILGLRTTRPKTDGELRVLTKTGERRSACSSHDVYDRQVEAFNLAVLEDREPSASGLDGLRSVELAEAIVRSAREGTMARLAADG
jgi:1,5-anhydro-D-fructose reductase (1,5-anhydro-D-mannitol-forming)